MDRTRPVLVLTRGSQAMSRRVTVAGITSTIRGGAVEVPVGRGNGLDHDSVVNLDDIWTIERRLLGAPIGYLSDDQEPDLHAAITRAFDLEN
jgi:mRNA interferase MazF